MARSQEQEKEARTKKVPAWLLALGDEGPPGRLELDSGTYLLERVFKHDFFACTARYRRADKSGGSGQARDRLVLKAGRARSILGIPMGWIGRLLAWHEAGAYAKLAPVAAVPELVGRHGPRALLRHHVEGEELRRDAPVPDDFFERLRAAVLEIHALGIACVDLEKSSNVLVGEDGAPYLVDFQISWHWPARLGGDLWPLRRLRESFQRADLYHVEKLKRRVRPDLMSAEEVTASRRRPRGVRVHGRVLRPLVRVRRRLLDRVDPGGKSARKLGVERGRVLTPADPEP